MQRGVQPNFVCIVRCTSMVVCYGIKPNTWFLELCTMKYTPPDVVPHLPMPRRQAIPWRVYFLVHDTKTCVTVSYY